MGKPGLKDCHSHSKKLPSSCSVAVIDCTLISKNALENKTKHKYVSSHVGRVVRAVALQSSKIAILLGTRFKSRSMKEELWLESNYIPLVFIRYIPMVHIVLPAMPSSDGSDIMVPSQNTLSLVKDRCRCSTWKTAHSGPTCEKL